MINLSLYVYCNTIIISGMLTRSRELRAKSKVKTAKSNVKEAKSIEHRVKIKSKERRTKRIEHGAESKESFLKPMNDLFPIFSSLF
jgi:hypothetical protein